MLPSKKMHCVNTYVFVGLFCLVCQLFSYIEQCKRTDTFEDAEKNVQAPLKQISSLNAVTCSDAK